MLKSKFINLQEEDTPLIVVHAREKNTFSNIKQSVNSEMFLRVQEHSAGYNKLVITSVGDSIRMYTGGIDFSNCAIYLELDLKETDPETIDKVRNADHWSIAIAYFCDMHTVEEVFKFKINRKTEEIYGQHYENKNGLNARSY